MPRLTFIDPTLPASAVASGCLLFNTALLNQHDNGNSSTLEDRPVRQTKRQGLPLEATVKGSAATADETPPASWWRSASSWGGGPRCLRTSVRKTVTVVSNGTAEDPLPRLWPYDFASGIPRFERAAAVCVLVRSLASRCRHDNASIEFRAAAPLKSRMTGL